MSELRGEDSRLLARASDLGTLQAWMRHVVQHEADAATAVRAPQCRALLPSPAVRRGTVVRHAANATALQRLDVYNGGYLARLTEVLASDYPGLRHALGETSFRDLAQAYVAHHPSRHPNLNQLGRHVPAFVGAQRRLPHRAFLRDLAMLELSMCEAFDAPEFAPLSATELQQVPPERWPRARLPLNPSVRLVRTVHPVDEYLQAVLEGEQPTLAPVRRAAHVVVHRREHRVWRWPVPRHILDVLRALDGGATLEAALARGRPPAADVAKWFQQLTAAGLFAAVVLPEPAPASD